MNKQNPLMAGLIASGKPLWQQVVEMLGADTEEVDM